MKEKRVLRPKTVVERGGFFFLFYHHSSPLSIPRSRSIDNSLVIPFISPYYPIVLPFLQQYYPFFLLLYIINMRVEKSGVSFTYCFELKTMILRQD